MTGERFARFETTLRGMERRGLGRRLSSQAGRDFSSNDYLGLASSPLLRQAAAEALARGVPLGAGGSRLLRGNHPEHIALEQEAATFFGAPRCLFFGSGYAANVALLSTLPARGDLILYDALVHASSHDGIRASRAESRVFPHNDSATVAQILRQWRQEGGRGTPWIVVESLYSMDGDIAPLAALQALAQAEDGFLVVDEAHATGIFGQNGRGLSEPDYSHQLTLHTCGKALGVEGALLAADARLIDTLINRARPFIYATAPSPLLAATLRAVLRVVAKGDDMRRELAALVEYTGQSFNKIGVPGSGSHITPVMVGDSSAALALARDLQQAGFDCRAIRPPTVPDGTARIRVSITRNVDHAAITALAETLARLLPTRVAA